MYQNYFLVHVIGKPFYFAMVVKIEKLIMIFTIECFAICLCVMSLVTSVRHQPLVPYVEALNLVVLSILRKHKNILVSSVISEHLDSASSQKTRGTHLSCLANIMASDNIWIQRARASADMILALFSRNIPVSALEGLKLLALMTWAT